MQYSTDGENWRTAYGSDEINIAQGQSLYLRGNNPPGWSKGFSQYSTLSITGDASITGNVMGLLDNGAASEEGDITDIPCDYCFFGLFLDSTGITSISDDFLPATSLATGCYYGMFACCTSLTAAPELPATTLIDNCYDSMFNGCWKLNSIKIGYTGYYDLNSMRNWVEGVADSGTFYYNGGYTPQHFQLPSGWTKTPF